MDRLIFHNDRVIPLQQAQLSPGQMGLLMGWGVFTTLRIYEGFPFAFERHWARLSHDAERLGMSIGYERGIVWEAIVQLAAANRRPEGMARLSVVKNQGGLWAEAPGCPPTDLLIFTRELVPWPAAHRLIIRSNAVYSGHRLAGAKMTSWVQNAATLERVHAEGLDDALLLNERGHLVECTSANVFLIRDRRVLTPPLSSGCLPGVTRDVLKEVIPQARLALQEEDLAPDDLSSAQEVFISSTTREVAGVGCIYSHPPEKESLLARFDSAHASTALSALSKSKGRPELVEGQASWSFQAPGKVTQALQEAFRQYVKTHLARRSPTL